MGKTTKILIAEDEKLNFILLKKLLEKTIKSDFNIIHAANGQEAIDFCDVEVDVVLMDIGMPKIDGYEATKILKEEYPDLPIIIQTAHCSVEHEQRAVSVGASAFLPKPIIRKDFQNLIMKFIPNAIFNINL